MRGNPIYLVSLVSFLLNYAVETSLVFIPLLGAQLGGSDFQVGLVGTAYGGAYFLSSLYCGRQSDCRGKIGFIKIGLLLCAIAFALQLLVRDLYVLMLVRSIVGLSMGITTAALVAYAFELKSDMGKFSSWGSLGWIAGAVSAAWLTEISQLFVISALCCIFAFSISWSFPKQSPTGFISDKGSSPYIKKALYRNLPIYFSVFLRHLGATAVWVILPLYLNEQGMSRSWMALAWGANFAVQFVVMRFLERFNPYQVFTVGQIISIVTFIAFVLYYNPWFTLLVQAMLGVGWSCLYVGALLLVLRAGENKGTASGIFYATLNLCNVIGPFLGGVIAQSWNYQGVMIFAAVLGAAGLLVTVPRIKTPGITNAGRAN